MSRREQNRAAAAARLAARAGNGGLGDFPVHRLVDLLNDPALTAPTPWLVPGILPKGAAVMLYGAPKVGKTTLASAIVAAVASGTPFLGRPVSPVPVLYVDLERPRRLTVHRLAEPFHGEPPPDSIIVANRRPSLEVFRQVIRGHGIGLAVLDTLLRLTGLEDENSAAEVNRKLSPWVELAHEEGVTLLFNHHDRKSGGVHGAGARGSNNIVGTVDVAAHLTREPGDASDGRRRLQTVSNFDGVEEDIILRREGSTYATAPTLAQLRQERVLTALRGAPEPVAVEALAAQTGESRPALLPDLSLLLGSGQIERLGRGVRGDPHLYRVAPADSVRARESEGVTETCAWSPLPEDGRQLAPEEVEI